MSSQGGEISVLHVDDDPDLGDLVAVHLERVHENISVCTEHTAADGLARLSEAAFDCVVSDHDMPGMDGLEFLRVVREEYEELPFILFTGKGNEEIASDAISAGVTEYLQKGVGTDQYTVLANRIERAVGEIRAKTALEESERMLSTLISNLPGMVYRARNEPDWPMEFVSDGAAELVGYSSEAFERGDVSWGTLIKESEKERLWETVQTCIAAGEPFEVSYQVETADGETRWMWERGRVVDTDEDGVEILEGFITDVTAREERERELANQRVFTEKLIDAIDDAFYVVGPDGTLLRWNDTVPAVTGYTDAELSTRTIDDLIADEDHEKLWSVFEETLETGHGTVEAGVETADGETLQYEFKGSLIEDEHGELYGIAGIGRDISERERRERALSQYRTLVENVGDPMFILDTEGYIEMANKAMCNYLNQDRETVLGTHVGAYVAEADLQTGLRLLEELRTDPDRSWATYEMEVTGRNGPNRLTENKVAALTDDDGRFIGSVGIVRDITKRKRREQKRKQYETLVENVGDPMYVLDTDGTIEMVNEAMAAHLGYDRSEIVGSDPTRFMPEEDVQTGTALIRELLDDDERTWAAFEMRTESADGTVRFNEDKVAPLFDEDGNFDGSVGVMRETTERRQRQRELERYETIIEAVGDPVYTLDDGGVFTYANEAVEQLTGFAPEALVGEHISTIMTGEDINRGNELIRTMLSDPDRRNVTFETEIVDQSGEHTPIEIHIALLPAAEGAFKGTAGVIRDISDRKARERQLAEFASVVSHDLRNPLNVVKGRLSVARESGDIGHLDAAESAADRMEELISDLLTLARQGETVGETAAVDIAAVASQAWADVETAEATLEQHGTTTVEADAARLREVFENLFRNSVEHASTRSRPGADDTVEHGSTGSRSGADDTVEHESRQTESHSTGEQGSTEDPAEPLTVSIGKTADGFYVADDGAGIPPDERDTVFERGYTTSENGTGFGLAIVSEVARAHGWSVSVTEGEDGGARFEFTTSSER